MSFFQLFKENFKQIANITDHIDTQEAAQSIRDNIYFRGPNVWILAFSIIIASVGLNVNSTAVIIGAMLISPLMGPIIGIGLAMGINDTNLVKDGLKNLCIMVTISLIASFIYFLITPLELANPTELEARTNPTIYDVLIALFGGLAGIFEISRKKKGTVLAGVAIATALMPPLCTAGYGLANLNFSYFFGALFLFCINGVFIIFATYIATKYLGYSEYHFIDEKKARRSRNLISLIMVVILVPSFWSAFIMIRNNRFAKQISTFVSENKTLSNSYIYDYKMDYKHGGKVTLYITGGNITTEDKERLIRAAEKEGIPFNKLDFKHHEYAGSNDETSQKLIKGIYDRYDAEIAKKDKAIMELEEQIKALEDAQIPYLQIYKEINSQYPNITNIYIARGANVVKDSIIHNGIILYTNTKLGAYNTDKLTKWLRIRLNDSTAVIINN